MSVAAHTPRHADIGVVIPARNAAATLSAALASIAAQTVRPREVVVVDDASDDDTAAVAASWCTQLPVRVERLDHNRGPGRARHFGVECTRAELVAFLDADDVWLPDHLEACLAALGGRTAVVAAPGIRWRPGAGLDRAALLYRGIDPPPNDQLAWIVRRHTYGTHVVMPREVYERVGGFDPAMEGVEDWDLWIRVVRAGVPLERTTNPTFLYRQHAGNLSLSVERVGLAGLRMLDRLARELGESGEGAALKPAFRESRARIALNLAYAHLDRYDLGTARRWGVRAIPGPRHIALRGALVALVPRWMANTRRTRAGRGTTPAPRTHRSRASG